MTFHNPVELQSDSTIVVEAYVPDANSIQRGVPGTEGVLDNVVSGAYSLTKYGDGKLTITNPLSGWGGDTHILTAPTDSSSPTGAGLSVLSLSNPILAAARDVYLSATRTALDLNFTGTDTINSFFIDNVEQASGTWGAIGAVALGADHETSLITGTGWLDVTPFVSPGVDGDYNDDGKVDAADYAIWRKNVGTSNMLPHDPTGGTIGSAQYDTWRTNFGGSAPGSGASLGAAAVPEPAAAGLILFGSLTFIALRRRSVSI